MRQKSFLRVTGLRGTRHADQDLGDGQGVELDETDPSNEVIFGRRRPDSIAVDWNNKVLHVLEFKRTSDQRHTYRERGESRSRAQHDVLVRSLEKVAEEAEGENGRRSSLGPRWVIGGSPIFGRHPWVPAEN
jgi:hypothetical protein